MCAGNMPQQRVLVLFCVPPSLQYGSCDTGGSSTFCLRGPACCSPHWYILYNCMRAFVSEHMHTRSCHTYHTLHCWQVVNAASVLSDTSAAPHCHKHFLVY